MMDVETSTRNKHSGELKRGTNPLYFNKAAPAANRSHHGILVRLMEVIMIYFLLYVFVLYIILRPQSKDAVELRTEIPVWSFVPTNQSEVGRSQGGDGYAHMTRPGHYRNWTV